MLACLVPVFFFLLLFDQFTDATTKQTDRCVFQFSTVFSLHKPFASFFVSNVCNQDSKTL